MKWYSKLALALALVVALGVVALALDASKFRGHIVAVGANAKFKTAATSTGTQTPIQKSMVFEIRDSLSANSATLGVVTLPRAITVQQIDVWANSVYAPDADTAAIIYFRSGSTGATAWLDSNGTYQSTNMTDVDFAAAAQCSLLTTDGGGTETGGIGGTITVWYTDN